MDCFGVKKKSNSNQSEKEVRALIEKVRLLQEEIKDITCEREKESRSYERENMVFAFKEAEWKQERKKMKEEVKRLRKALEVKEEESRGKEDGLLLGGEDQKYQNWLFSSSGNNTASAIACSLLVEQMKEERVWRDEAVDKWKKLYLAIKTELDDLIQITHRGDGLCRKAEEEDMIEELKMEVKARDKTIEELKARVESAEQEEYKRAREVDILRQSLRIMSSIKSPSCASSKPKSGHVKQARKAQPFK